MVNKVATSLSAGWHAGLSQDEFGLNNVFSEQRTSDNNDRRILRTPGSNADPFPNTLSDIGVTATDLNLYVVHFTGIASGPPDGALFWINGDTNTAVSRQYSFASLKPGNVTTNDEPMRIRGAANHVADNPARGFVGNIQFIEIWEGDTAGDGMFLDEYSAWGWNGGSPVILGDTGPVEVTSTPVPAPNSASFTFNSQAGKDHMLQSATDLVAPDWTDTGYVFPGTGGSLSGFDPGGADGKAYRLVER